MRRTPAFGPRLTMLTVGLGTVGIVGAVIAVVDPGSMLSAASVLAIVVFHLSTGWRTLTVATKWALRVQPWPMGSAPAERGVHERRPAARWAR